MTKVLITVHSGAARFDVAVLAHSPEQALSLIGTRYRLERGPAETPDRFRTRR